LSDIVADHYAQFKCNLRDIRSGYPNLHKWVRYCYWKNPAFGETTEFTHSTYNPRASFVNLVIGNVG